MRGISAWLILICLLLVLFVIFGGLERRLMIIVLIGAGVLATVAVTFLLKGGPR